MATPLQRLRLTRTGRTRHESQMIQMQSADRSHQPMTASIDIVPNDPIVAYFLSAPGAVEVDKLYLDSPALQALKAAGVKIAVPLVSQGELVGLLNLGPRLSEQDYSTDDRGLLNTLATQSAPAVRVAQLVRDQQAQARANERIQHELRVAQLIQKTLLPKDLPALPGWQISEYYQAARQVGGDFYDFIYFDDGRLGLVIGDVTDKGVPAALLMATTRSVLRAVAQRVAAPGEVLERVNEILHPDIPPKMFVTCLYALLDPESGQLRYANAGHDLPYHRHTTGEVTELRATGMPLGLMPGMHYEEKETQLAPGEVILFHSDGIVEAHNEHREMFGFPRLMRLVGAHEDGKTLKQFILDDLAAFTGANWEQEDDITMVTLQRSGGYGVTEVASRSTTRSNEADGNNGNDWRTLAEFTLASEPGNERQALAGVAEAVRVLNLPTRRLEQLKTAVAEATMNAMEHGNHYQPDKPVSIEVLASHKALSVRVTDHGGTRTLPAHPDIEAPDLEAKLAELQTPRGWGLFLIKNMVDEMHISNDASHHTVELILYLEGESHASEKS
ncbi:MAG TPA: SpoIIE family protein phosphatase [Ktedonobacteraceae bacterium]|nr:SpoIIE family protein phosphatase [Ktedonobacteraceae bacterium]